MTGIRIQSHRGSALSFELFLGNPPHFLEPSKGDIDTFRNDMVDAALVRRSVCLHRRLGSREGNVGLFRHSFEPWMKRAREQSD